MDEIAFEQALAQLERVVAELEQGEMTLDEALATFQEGVKLLRLCITKLNKFEEQIEVLLEDYYAEAPPWLSGQDGGGRQK